MTEVASPPLSPSPVKRSPVLLAVYAFLFCILLPSLLLAWSRTMPLQMPAIYSPFAGAGATIVGLALMLFGMAALWRRGGGLPMNIAPPPNLVSSGVYAISSHPIYLGFCIACVGLSLWFASPAGLWVISPMVALACFSIVAGYERHDLISRFGGTYASYSPLLSIPPTGQQRPTPIQRLSVYLIVLLPWLLLYELTAQIPPTPQSLPTNLPFERSWPVLPWTELIYGSAYLAILAVPLLILTRDNLRRFTIEGLWGTAIATFCFIAFPLTVQPRPFDSHAFAGSLLALERQLDPGIGNACPSFHGFWALLAAATLSTRSRPWALAAWTYAVAVNLSCITTGQHSVIDILSAVALFILVRRLPTLYHAALRYAQALANSYHSWRIGPLRIVNHSTWSFAAGTLGALLIGCLAGPSHLPAVTLVGVCTLLGAMLWAQWIEGSPRLLRPFGYYGAIVGASAACLAAPLLGTNALLIFTATATAAPFIQAIGRVRCLVQGCCHGKPVQHPHFGFTVTNPSSRVCALAHLNGVSIHPTQLYSILANAAIGLLLLRLYFAAAPQSLITGLYLALAGFSRFIEESYRGEPQTRRWLGLPEYQWYAALSSITGCVLMALPLHAAAPTPHISPSLLYLAPALGTLTALMLSVDFPESHTRFARLTG